MKNRAGFIVAAAFFLVLSLPVCRGYADSIDIGNPPLSGNYLYNNNEVEQISPTYLGMEASGGGDDVSFNNPVLLIIGVPNAANNFDAPGITLSSGTGSLGGKSAYGGNWNNQTGYAGSFTSGSVYNFLGLQGTTKSSNSFNNWQDAELAANGINANNFGVYVYELNNANLSNGQTEGVTFNSGLPKGSYAVAYGQSGKGNDGDDFSVFSTPLTEAGLTNRPVPETASIFLLGAGLLGLVFIGEKGT